MICFYVLFFMLFVFVIVSCSKKNKLCLINNTSFDKQPAMLLDKICNCFNNSFVFDETFKKHFAKSTKTYFFFSVCSQYCEEELFFGIIIFPFIKAPNWNFFRKLLQLFFLKKVNFLFVLF